MDFNLQKKLKELEDNIITLLKNNYALLHLDRANPNLIEVIKVNIYGQLQSLKNVAWISNIDVQTLLVKPWDKSQIQSVSKAISDADLWLSINISTDWIIVKFPSLTEERRQKIDKMAKAQLEESKKHLRTQRETIIKEINWLSKNDKSISEDILKQHKITLDKKVKEIWDKLENIFSEKSKQIFKL